ncbi:cytochrome c biogenesis protein CcdA [Gallaecimonas pentaromativorans]|uniref:redoxin domain-containing protein n=1 Tax=Gallaecimonas pentaromativorans TaxID=584787 RepID=UPI003A8D56D1
MTLFILAYLAGIVTIISPCIVPILPFVFARTGQSFRQSLLPMLLGLALAFALVASLTAVTGNWAQTTNHIGREVALAIMALFGLGLLFPSLANWASRPLVRAGSHLSGWAQKQSNGLLRSVVLGLATGLLWAPCAGPVLGLILSGAALNGPGPQTTLLLLAYGLGTATSLGLAMVAGQRLVAWLAPSFRQLNMLRRVGGVTVIASVVVIGFGADTRLLQGLSLAQTDSVEQALIRTVQSPLNLLGTPAEAAPMDDSDHLTGPLDALLGRQGGINTPPLTATDLRGKVVLVDFWTYSCINCLRTLPYLRSWAAKYHDKGLVVVGVHTPEFAFERDKGNVEAAVKSLGLTYPIVQDNRFEIWRAFGNNSWPAFYLVDAKGTPRYRMLGEGNYNQTERAIQQLLAEAKGHVVDQPLTPANGTGIGLPPNWSDLDSPETYLGYDQAERFANRGALVKRSPSYYQYVDPLPLNQWSLSGAWNVGPGFATVVKTGSGVRFRFHARDLNLVMRPGADNKPVHFRVLINGSAPGKDHGVDVDEQGYGVIRASRLYQLARLASDVKNTTLEIQFLDPGARLYSFTFG